MKINFRRQALLPVVAMLIYSGCAKHPAVTGDTPLGGNLPTASLTQTAPPVPQASQEEKKPLPPANVSESTPFKEETPQVAQGTSSTSPAPSLQAALGKIYFDFDSADLSTVARQQLSENYQVLKKKRRGGRIHQALPNPV